ncbi:MAG: hypothetical protein KF901_24070 [Myxococcales bacterium]|nr:hypothetical protein [Myxococcales bacterium]
MNRSYLFWLAFSALFVLNACGKEQPAINRVGVNVVDKALFTGSWYYSRVVIDVDYEAAGIGTFPGDSAYDFVGSDLGSMPRVRWVIDEDMLYAYRDYEIIEGINPPGSPATTPGATLTHPVAAFAIESHFDIRRLYNSVTGEERNVIVENTEDRRWYQRQFMRVNWSKNHLPGYYGQIANLYEVIGFYNREPADLFVQGASDFPSSWQPQFHFMRCASADDETCTPGDRDYVNDYEQGELYHFSFVTQELLSPGNVPNPFTGGMVNWCISPYADAPNCVTNAVYIRNAFLKVTPRRQYQAVDWNDSRFDRAGYFRLERGTYDRSTSAEDPSWGTTDFLNYGANRQNMWYDWVDEAGNPVPYRERRVRPIIWYTTHELPAHLVQPSYDLVSRWNEVYMRMVRILRGEPLPEYADVSCQTEDPNGYCFCTPDPRNPGTSINPTCPGRYDPFADPSATGATNPYQCHVAFPADGTRPNLNDPGLTDAMFSDWFRAEMVGSECVNVLRINTCNRATIAANGGSMEGLDCQERGDARFKFLSYVDQPGTGFLGIATMRGDPVSGEIIVGDSNIGGPALDGYRTQALQWYDFINGRLGNRDLIVGEDVRSYVENLSNIQPPAPPREEFSVATRAPNLLPERRELRNVMERYASRGELLRGNEGRARIFSDRRQALRGTDTERRLMENYETLAMAGIQTLPDGVGPADINDNILDRVSPFRISAPELMARQEEIERKLGKANVLLPNEFIDNSVLEFVNRHSDWPRARLEITLNQLLYYQTQLHEMGHCLGLRHSFMASADVPNYGRDYHAINQAIPVPDPVDFDVDGTVGLSPTEQMAWEDAYREAKRLRELAGIDRHMDSSTMDYSAQWYQRVGGGAQGIGTYDDMAVSFAYADVVELYDNRETRLPAEQLNTLTGRRIWAKYYFGGESCNVDADCPFSASGRRSADLLDGNRAAGLVQSCVPNPEGAARGNICSNYDADARALLSGAGVQNFVPVEYKFCTDDRVGTDAQCHRFDEGDSYREIVRNISEQYDRQYLFTNFRRYRRNFNLGTYLFGRLIDRQLNILQSIFQNLLYNYQVDPEFRDSTGPFGFEDQFLATADTMNFYARIMAQPSLGSYQYDPGWQRYQLRSLDANLAGAQLSLPLGMARYQSSEYQAGLSGIQRIELIGTFYEKWFVMQLLTSRGFAANYTRDIPFWTNFYDLFPVEMQQVFQGLILDQPEAIAPRVECRSGTFPNCRDPRLVYMDLYRGDCSDPATCRPAPEENYAGLNVVNPGAGSLLQFLAAVFALSDFPVFYDSSFQNQLFVCIVGNGRCNEPSASAREYVLGGTVSVEDADYVQYFSERYGKTFIAWQIEPGVGVPNQRSLGFEMVRRANETDFIFDALRTYSGEFGGTPFSMANLTAQQVAGLAEIGYTIPTDAGRFSEELSRIDGWMRSQESFFFQLIQLQSQFGIQHYIRF